ncbi:hypothetical protein KO02_18220 [Sphingobacterium sp. ML3W]|nr:hypothetical protein KO02_18220 [Sphingobacterium sp. ML3W]
MQVTFKYKQFEIRVHFLKCKLKELEVTLTSIQVKSIINIATFFCFFSLVADLERKEVDPKSNIGILNIPRKYLTTCLMKCKEGNYGVVHFGKGIAPIKCKNAFLIEVRNCFFATRPDSYRGWVRQLLLVGY